MVPTRKIDWQVEVLAKCEQLGGNLLGRQLPSGSCFRVQDTVLRGMLSCCLRAGANHLLHVTGRHHAVARREGHSGRPASEQHR